MKQQNEPTIIEDLRLGDRLRLTKDGITEYGTVVPIETRDVYVGYPRFDLGVALDSDPQSAFYVYKLDHFADLNGASWQLLEHSG